MTKFQKIIKYFAISLAVLLIVSIFYTLVNIISSIFGISIKSENAEYIIRDIKNDVIELDVDIESAKITFKNDSSFKVESTNNVKINDNGKKLTIKERNFLFNDTNEEIIIYLPISKQFNEVSIDAGCSDVFIENLITNKLDLDIGAGKVESKSLNVSGNASLDTGAGQINVNGALINNLDLDMGIGEVIINGTLTGMTDIDAGVGKLDINLNEFINNYSFQIQKGVGEIYINGKIIKDNYIYGVGGNTINIDGGIGEININTLN